MGEHADLAAVVGFVGQHVTKHFKANRPGGCPAISAEFLDAAGSSAECVRKHFGAASGAFGQCRAGLLRGAAGAAELSRNLEVRSGKPDPLGANIVHVSEDGDDRAGLTGRLGAPSRRLKMLDEHLVHALIGRKDLDCRSADWRVSVGLAGLTRGHGSRL